MKAFRPSYAGGTIVAFGGTPFILVGAGGLAVGIDDGHTEWYGYLFFLGFFLAGLLCSISGIAFLAFSVEVASDGMSRSSWFGLVVHRDSWNSLRSWTTGKLNDADIADPRFVEFNFEQRSGPLRIEASMVVNPGFQEFLDEIRFHVSWKEILELPDIPKGV